MILEVLTILTALLLTYKLIKNAQERRKRPPGPIRWPIIGNLIEIYLENPKYPHLALAQLAKKYGPVMSFGYGVHDAVIISSHEAMKDILKQDDMLGRHTFPYSVDRSNDKQLGLVWEEDPYWRDIRKYLLRTLRQHGFGKTTTMASICRKEVDRLVTCIGTLADKNEGVVRIDARNFTVCSSNVFLALLGGKRFEYDDEDFLQFLGISGIEINLLSLKYICNPFPFLRRWFPKQMRHEDNLLIYRKLQEFIGDIFQASKDMRAAREDTKAQTVLEEFVDEIVKNRGNPSSFCTDGRMTLALLDLLSGAEIIGPMLKWTFLFLTLNVKAQRQIQQEISAVEEEVDGPVSIFHYERMPYTQAVIFECLRMANISPLPPPRKALRDCYYNNYKIPKNTIVMWNLHPMLSDVKIWGDPDVFRPERFLDDAGRLVNTELITSIFGFGKRVCPGNNFAWDLIFMATTGLLKVYEFQAIPGKEPSIENPYSAVTMSPKSFDVTVILRNL